MNLILKNWPIFLVAVASIIAVVATFINDTKDAAQKDNIENLGKINVGLSKETKKLTALNTEISIKIEQITSANKKTSNENLLLSQQSAELISEVRKLTIETQNLITTIDKRTANEVAENLQTGELLMDFKQPLPDDVFIKIGGNVFGNSIKNLKNGAKMFMVGNKDPISLNFDQNSRIMISMKVFDLKGNLIAEIENNSWRPNRNFTGKFNYDDKGFEVIDNEGNIAVNIDMVGLNQLNIQGVFPMKDQNIIIFAGDRLSTLPFVKTSRVNETIYRLQQMGYDEYLKYTIQNLGIKQLFEYTGKNWLHKRKKID